MILADKIINLRKKNGWSQEELANQLGVSRQSVSKYESAQAIPDMDKILKLSNIFGVTTDYLIKDEIEDEEPTYSDVVEYDDDDTPVRKVSVEEANELIAYRKKTALPIGIATFLCIISPITLIVLAAVSEMENSVITETAAVAIGIGVLLALVFTAIPIFIINSGKSEKFEFLEKEKIETAYGVSGIMKEAKEKFTPKYTIFNTIGIMLCVIAVIPLVVSAILTENAVVVCSMVGLLLFMIAVGVFLIIQVNHVMSAYDSLLEEGDYSKERKSNRRKFGGIATAYWLIATAIYLAISFITNLWDYTWIVWPVAGVLYPVFIFIVKTVSQNKD